jgi:hypothetical protein
VTIINFITHVLQYFSFVELVYLDYAFCHLLQYIDSGNSQITKLIGHDIATLLLSEDKELELKEYYTMHNIRKINVRSLSELLALITRTRYSFNNVQNYRWIKYFNADCTFSICKFQQNFPSINYDSTKELKSVKKQPLRRRTRELQSVRKQLLERMTYLDNLLHTVSDKYRGQLKPNAKAICLLIHPLFLLSLLYIYCRASMFGLCIPSTTSTYG